jgi:hypothetical protein
LYQIKSESDLSESESELTVVIVVVQAVRLVVEVSDDAGGSESPEARDADASRASFVVVGCYSKLSVVLVAVRI